MAQDRALRRVADLVLDWPPVDALLSVLAGWFVAWVAAWRPLVDAPVGDRAAIYSSAGSLVAVVGGLGSVAVAVYMGRTGVRARRLRAVSGVPLRRNWWMIMMATLVSAIACWLAQIMDASKHPTVAWAMVVTAVVWCVLTGCRQAWLFLALMAVQDKDQAAPTAKPARVDEKWTRRAHSATKADSAHDTAGPLRL